MNKRVLIRLLFLFAVIVFVKVISVFLIHGTTVFPDSACFVQRSILFAKSFKLTSCQKLTGFESGGEFPLYIFFLSPFYLLFKGKMAYFAVLIAQAIFSASLIFPLFYIIKNFIKENKTALLISTVILFFSPIVSYEKMLMSEFLFIFVNIWFLFFYLRGNKLFFVLFAFLAAFIRPFGFIVILAMIINELILSKNKKKYFFLLFIGICSVFGLMYFWLPNIFSTLYAKLLFLLDFKNIAFLFRAISNQINSFTIALFFLPIPIFVSFFYVKDSKKWKNIRFFILTFIILNFLISTQHVLGYFIEGKELGLLTRYINMSIIYIVLFALIFMSRYKKLQNKKIVFIFIIICLLSFFFLEIVSERAQNIEISGMFDYFSNLKNKSVFISSIKYPLFVLYLLFAFLIFKVRLKILRNILIFALLFFSILNIRFLSLASYNSSLVDYLIDYPAAKITYIISPHNPLMPEYWNLLSYSDYKIDYKPNYDETQLIMSYDSIDSDFIISFFEIDDLEKKVEFDFRGVFYYVYEL